MRTHPVVLSVLLLGVMSGTAVSAMAQSPADTLRFVNPPTLSAPRGYSHMVEVPAGSRLVYIAGQVPRTVQAPGTAAAAAPSIQGAWRVVEVAARAPGETWAARPGPQAGLYVFAARHYSYFYVPGVQPRPRFAEANRPTEAEKAAAYDTFIAGAGSYTFDGRTLALKADLRKNPNEMTGELWRWQAEAQGDTLRLVFVDPPFLPGREWRITLVKEP